MTFFEEVEQANIHEPYIAKTNLLSKYPTVKFEDGTEMRDIWINIRVNIKNELEENINKYCMLYKIQNDESIEYVCCKFYNDPNLIWTIFMINDIFNPYFDLPLKYEELEELTVIVVEKLKNYVNTTYKDREIERLQKLSMIDYANIFYCLEEINEKKKEIYLIKPEYIHEFVYLVQEVILEHENNKFNWVYHSEKDMNE